MARSPRQRANYKRKKALVMALKQKWQDEKAKAARIVEPHKKLLAQAKADDAEAAYRDAKREFDRLNRPRKKGLLDGLFG